MIKTALFVLIINVPALLLAALAYYALSHGHAWFALFAGLLAALVVHTFGGGGKR